MPSDIDLDGDGVISVAEAKAATNQLVTLRRLFFVVLAMLGTQQVMMFGTVYWASQLASEVHVRDTELRDDRGRQVSTVQRRDRIDGLHYPHEDRRLSVGAGTPNETGSDASDSGNVTRSDTDETGNDTVVNGTHGFQNVNVSDAAFSNVNESTSGDRGFHGSMEISQAYFQGVWDGYMSGKSDWVVPFPDGSVRTVLIQGMSSTYAWGICGACPGGNVQWEATCPAKDDPNECSVVYEEVAISRRRRLVEEEEAAPAASSPLLARARARAVQADGGDAAVTMQGSMERSLGGKHCA